MSWLTKTRQALGYVRSVKRATSSGSGPRFDLLQDIVGNAFARPGESIFTRIEARRRELEQSPTVINFVDHGAGSGRPGETTVSHLARASKNKHWGYLLYRICNGIGAKSALELGSCVGISGSYIAAGSDALTTIEGDPSLAKIVQATFDGLGLPAKCQVGAFREVLPTVLPTVEPIDFAFIDGHHDGDATLEYLAQIRPHLSQGSIVAFDDIAWSEGMANAWGEIRSQSRSWIDLRQIGLIVVE